MILELASIFFNVITPVFALVIIGYFAGPRLGLDARTLSRGAYFILIPAFIFNVIGSASIEAALAARMIGFAALVHILIALVGGGIAILLRKPPSMIGAYTLIAVFGNVGNFGLPIIEFHLGEEALAAATVYFLAILVVSFVIGVVAANWFTGGSMAAVLAVFKTPALIAVVPAVLVNVLAIEVPIMVTRITGLLGQAMVPTMLLALGVQLSGNSQIRLDRDMMIASSIRLLGSPLLAILLVGTFGLTGIERGAGILQSAMPAAVLTSIIALEYNLLPDFVTQTVLFSNLASVVTLTFLIAFI
ncbi:MAG: AEC family transporter [Chloroflexota bacterium]